MISFFVTLAFVALPQRQDAILSANKDRLHVDASVSIGLDKHGKCIQTYPNETLIGDRESDWCSNIAKGDDHPWISYHIPNTAMKLTGYSVRNGCCEFPCCCDPQTGEFFPHDDCCCELVGFSLQGSNDNRTWYTIHQIQNKRDFYFCKYETYEFQMTQSFNFIRFYLEQELDGCPRCLQINQIELYGQTISSFSYRDLDDDDDNQESISIIGKIRKE